MALPTSGPNFDFSMFPRKYWGDALSGVGADIAGALQWKREQERKEEADRQKARFENDQNANSLFGKQEQEREHKLHEAQSQAGLRGGLAKNLSALLGQGRTDEAEATAKASAFEVGDTGETAGVGLKRMLQGPGDQLLPYADLPAAAPGGPAPAPTSQGQILSRFLGAQPKPESLEPPAFGQDPQEPAPDMARAAAGLSSLGGQASLLQTAGGAADQDKQAQDAYQSGQQQSDADRQKQQQEHDKAVRWQMSFPSGEKQTLDPNQSRQAARQQAEEEAQYAEAQLANEHDPMAREALRRTVIEKRAMLSNMDKAAVNNAAGQSASQGFKHDEAAIHDMTAGQKFTIGMRPREVRSQGPDSIPAKRYDLAVSAEARNKMNAALNQGEFKTVVESQRTLSQMVGLLKSDNSANHKLAGGLWAKWASGPGAVQQSEREEFMNTIGGKYGSFEKVLKNWQDGKLPDDQRQILVDAIEQQLMPTTQANYEGVKGAVHAMFANDPNQDIGKYADWADQYMDTYSHPSVVAPGKQRPPGAKPGGGAAPAAPTPTQPKPHPQDQAAVAEARARLKKNPQDGIAIQVLQMNGLAQ